MQVPGGQGTKGKYSNLKPGEALNTDEDIREDLSEEADKVDQNDRLNSSRKKGAGASVVDPNDRSIRKSFEESEIDGLIKWAKELPDDLAS